MIIYADAMLNPLRIAEHLVKNGDAWALDIPAADTKTRRALDFQFPEKCPRE